MVLYLNNLKRTLPNRSGRLVWMYDQQIPDCAYVCSPGSVGKSPSSLMVPASVSCNHGHTSDAETGTQQRPAATGPRIRPLQRQPHAVSRSIANQSQQPSAQTTGTSKQPQLKDILEPSLSTPNLVALPTSPIPLTPSSPLYLRNKRFKLWGSTRTALSTLFRVNVSYLRKQRKYKKS